MNELAVRRGHGIAFRRELAGAGWRSNCQSSRPPNLDKKQTAHLAAYSDKVGAGRQSQKLWNRGLEPDPRPREEDKSAQKLVDTWLAFLFYSFKILFLF